MSQDSPWTDQKVRELHKLWHEGLSVTKIGRRLGVSPNSVVSKVLRERLPRRPSPLPSKPAQTRPTVSAPKRAPKRTLPALASLQGEE